MSFPEKQNMGAPTMDNDKEYISFRMNIYEM